MKDGFKLLVPHREDCYLATTGRQEFIVGAATVYRDRIGRKGGSQMWHTFVCNVVDCPATVGVRWDVLMEFVTDGIAPANSQETR